MKKNVILTSEKREALKLGVDTQVILVQKGGKPESTAKKTEETYAKEIEFSKKKLTPIFFSCFCLVDSKSLASPCPRRFPVQLDPNLLQLLRARREGPEEGQGCGRLHQAGQVLLRTASHGAAADDVLGLGEGLKLLVGMRNGLIWGDVSGIFWGFLGIWLMSGVLIFWGYG